VQFGNLLTVVIVAGVVLAITTLEGLLLTPILLGRAARMNQVAVFVSLLFWSWVWGVFGTLLAIPIMMVVKVTCDQVDALRPLGELLGE
jgi:predicted PurR-regulated permease PerM